jgi:hypothetical protein
MPVVNREDADWFGPTPHSSYAERLNSILIAIEAVDREKLEGEYIRSGRELKGRGAGQDFRRIVEATLLSCFWQANVSYFKDAKGDLAHLKHEFVSPITGDSRAALEWCHGHASSIFGKIMKHILLSVPDLNASFIPSEIYLLVGTPQHNVQLGINGAAPDDKKVRRMLEALDRKLEIPVKLVSYSTVEGFSR